PYFAGETMSQLNHADGGRQPPKFTDISALVNFLFSCIRAPIGRTYINFRLIQLRCRKANIPNLDTMGAITAYRARTTVARTLYHAPRSQHRQAGGMAWP